LVLAVLRLLQVRVQMAQTVQILYLVLLHLRVAVVALIPAQELLAVRVAAAVLVEVRPALLPLIKAMLVGLEMLAEAEAEAAGQVLWVSLHPVDTMVELVVVVLHLLSQALSLIWLVVVVVGLMETPVVVLAVRVDKVVAVLVGMQILQQVLLVL
jgi:hypothetical protein